MVEREKSLPPELSIELVVDLLLFAFPYGAEQMNMPHVFWLGFGCWVIGLGIAVRMFWIFPVWSRKLSRLEKGLIAGILVAIFIFVVAKPTETAYGNRNADEAQATPHPASNPAPEPQPSPTVSPTPIPTPQPPKQAIPQKPVIPTPIERNPAPAPSGPQPICTQNAGRDAVIGPNSCNAGSPKFSATDAQMSTVETLMRPYAGTNINIQCIGNHQDVYDYCVKLGNAISAPVMRDLMSDVPPGIYASYTDSTLPATNRLGLALQRAKLIDGPLRADKVANPPNTLTIWISPMD